MSRTLFLIIGLLCLPSAALATTGWDRHDTEIAGFRIHGANGTSFVHSANAEPKFELALCGTLDENRQFVGLTGPPDYAVTDTYLAVRYSIIGTTTIDRPNYFLIRIEDGQVTGPMTETEFTKSPAVNTALLDWNTPLTAADRFQRFVKVVIACIVLLCLGLSVVALKCVRKYRSHRNSQRLDGQATFSA